MLFVKNAHFAILTLGLPIYDGVKENTLLDIILANLEPWRCLWCRTEAKTEEKSKISTSSPPHKKNAHGVHAFKIQGVKLEDISYPIPRGRRSRASASHPIFRSTVQSRCGPNLGEIDLGVNWVSIGGFLGVSWKSSIFTRCEPDACRRSASMCGPIFPVLFAMSGSLHSKFVCQTQATAINVLGRHR